jgi:acetyl esterase/lipase
MRIIVAPALALMAAADWAFAQGDTELRRDLQYATHDGVALAGDYYVPKAPGKYPVVVAVHGGGWQGGAKAGYRFWARISTSAALRSLRLTIVSPNRARRPIHRRSRTCVPPSSSSNRRRPI